MVARSVPKSARGDRAGKRRGRRAYGIQVVARDGHWHCLATVRAGGRSIRLRKSLGLAVVDVGQDQAEQAAAELVAEIRNRAGGKVGRGEPVAIAALAYLSAPRARPLNRSSAIIIKKITARFRERRLNEIDAGEWITWIDGAPDGSARGCVAGQASATRERFLNTVVAFLNFCRRHHGLATTPSFRRDRAATNPNRRARRRVEDLRPDLIQLLLDHAEIPMRVQIAIAIDTGARVSSILHGARLCDLNLAPGREMITFRRTKSGDDVHAVLGPLSIATLKQYLRWRGDLHDREAPLILTRYRKPYANNGTGGQNQKTFAGVRRRTIETLRARSRAASTKAARDQAAADAALIARVSMHWFRHRMATLWLRRDPRAAMEQGGWLDIRSIMGYAHDVPDSRGPRAAEWDQYAPAPPAARAAAGGEPG